MLIEYVKRLISCVKGLVEEDLEDDERESFDKFISHYVWSSKDKPQKPYWERL